MLGTAHDPVGGEDAREKTLSLGRRRRRYRDPATLPRRERPARAEKATRAAVSQETARLNTSIARHIAVIVAALVYFAVWALDASLGLFAPPAGLDLTHPQFVVGIAALLASTFVANALVNRYRTAELLRLAGLATAGLGLGGGIVLLLAGVGGPVRPSELFFAATGIVLTWVFATVWLLLLGRRARRLAPQG